MKEIEPNAACSFVCYIEGVPTVFVGTLVGDGGWVVETGDEHASSLKPGIPLMVLVQSGTTFRRLETSVSWAKRFGSQWRVGLNAAVWEEVDRRRHPRYRVQVPILLRVIGERSLRAGIEEIQVTSRDIGLGGVWVDCPTLLPIGTLVQVIAQLKPQETVRMLGAVAWSEDSGEGFGIEFVEYVGGARYYLHTFLSGLESAA
ncbi:MAG: PilZ domain-containing protein [Fimbriimonadaceae bacterium]